MKARLLVPLLLAAMVVALAGPAATAPGAAAAVTAARSARPVLTFASRGPLVRQAQALLNRHGYRVPVTGFYGLLTVRQVRRFQVAHGIRNTGQVGPLTWPRLLAGRGRPAAPRPPRPALAARPVLTFGSRGAAVREAQALLNRHGYRVPVTGLYWLGTVRQVRRFQVAHGIRNTGQVGPLTWPRLLAGSGRRPTARAVPKARPAPASRPARARTGPGGGGLVYLTFDDGPTPAYTPQVLALLARYRARATFFVVGRSAATWPELVRREFAAGHGVANHTWNHRRLTGLQGRRWQAEVDGTSEAIRQATGSPARCLRPPYGSVDAASAARARAGGLRLVGWDVDPYDWRRPGAWAIASRVLGRVRSGDVVLLHDGGGDRSQTVAALRQVLASLSARGFRFSSLCRG